MRTVPSKKLIPAWGGLLTHILGQISYFTPYCIDFGAAMCIFEVRESIFRSFVKIRPSVLVKMAVLCQIMARGRFC